MGRIILHDKIAGTPLLGGDMGIAPGTEGVHHAPPRVTRNGDAFDLYQFRHVVPTRRGQFDPLAVPDGTIAMRDAFHGPPEYRHSSPIPSRVLSEFVIVDEYGFIPRGMIVMLVGGQHRSYLEATGSGAGGGVPPAPPPFRLFSLRPFGGGGGAPPDRRRVVSVVHRLALGQCRYRVADVDQYSQHRIVVVVVIIIIVVSFAGPILPRRRRSIRRRRRRRRRHAHDEISHVVQQLRQRMHVHPSPHHLDPLLDRSRMLRGGNRPRPSRFVGPTRSSSHSTLQSPSHQ
mmetsp:Transcript_21832/g.64403  ORF Transcript_21832/g.64403 Transcript_21832/m.64403 type:complete len:287 (+) Transcript_21832:273-1133(+)